MRGLPIRRDRFDRHHPKLMIADDGPRPMPPPLFVAHRLRVP
jgi:hypothetical protein